MRFGGVLALLCFAYVLLAGLVQGVGYGPLLTQALVVLILYYAFGSAVGQLGEMVVVEELERAEATVEADLARIQHDTEELAGITRFRDQSIPAMTQELQPGQVIAEDVRGASGELVLRAGSPLTDAGIRRLIEDGVRKVRVQRA